MSRPCIVVNRGLPTERLIPDGLTIFHDLTVERAVSSSALDCWLAPGQPLSAGEREELARAMIQRWAAWGTSGIAGPLSRQNAPGSLERRVIEAARAYRAAELALDVIEERTDASDAEQADAEHVMLVAGEALAAATDALVAPPTSVIG